MNEAYPRPVPDEVERIVRIRVRDAEAAAQVLRVLTGASTSSDLAVGRNDFIPATPSADRDELVRRARQLIRNRGRRIDHFGQSMFGEPGWDMLLVLYSDPMRDQLTVSRLIELSGAPYTTALRWIGYLEKEHLVVRHPHPTDNRAQNISISEKGITTMEKYLSGTAPAER